MDTGSASTVPPGAHMCKNLYTSRRLQRISIVCKRKPHVTQKTNETVQQNNCCQCRSHKSLRGVHSLAAFETSRLHPLDSNFLHAAGSHGFIGFNNTSVFCLEFFNCATGFTVQVTLKFARHCSWHWNFQLSTRIFLRASQRPKSLLDA